MKSKKNKMTSNKNKIFNKNFLRNFSNLNNLKLNTNKLPMIIITHKKHKPELKTVMVQMRLPILKTIFLVTRKNFKKYMLRVKNRNRNTMKCLRIENKE